MPTATQTAVLILEDHFLNATPSAASEIVGQEATNAALPRTDSGWGPQDFDSANGQRKIIFDLGRARKLDCVACVGLKAAGTAVLATDVTWQVRGADDAAITSNVVDWLDEAYVLRASGGATARLDMPQPNLGPEDFQLPGVMNSSRLCGIHLRDVGSETEKRYWEIGFTNAAASNSDNTLFVPKLFGGWGRLTVDFRQFSADVIPLRNGDTLRKWVLSFAAVAEDELERKWLPNIQSGKRAFLALAPGDRPEYFLPNGAGGGGEAAMVEITSHGINRAPHGVRLFDAPDLDGYWYDVQLTCVERFNGETQA